MYGDFFAMIRSSSVSALERADSPAEDVRESMRGEVERGNRLLAEAREALASSPIVELRELLLQQFGRRAILAGKVSCFYYKQLAQETVRPHLDLLHLDNQVQVERRPPR